MRPRSVRFAIASPTLPASFAVTSVRFLNPDASSRMSSLMSSGCGATMGRVKWISSGRAAMLLAARPLRLVLVKCMNLSRLLLVPVLGIALLSGCKKDGGGDGASTESAKPLVTKPYDQLTKDDLNAAITGLGWTPGQSSNSQSGGYSNIMVTAKKATPEPQLTVAVFKVPADKLAADKVSRATEYAIDVQGNTILAVKYYPKDPAASAKTLSRLLGK